MKIYSQSRLALTTLNKPFYIYGAAIVNPHGDSGIYDVRNWPCRKKVRTPKQRKMTKAEREREFKICMMKAEIELSKRKVKSMLDEFVNEATNKALQTL